MLPCLKVRRRSERRRNQQTRLKAVAREGGRKSDDLEPSEENLSKRME